MPAYNYDPSNPHRSYYNPYHHRELQLPIEPPSEEPEVTQTATITPQIQRIDSFTDEQPPQ
jgi:hypothetical protein